MHELRKAHYIKCWFSNGKWNYEYPAKYKNSNRTKTKIDIAKGTKLITGIQPLQNVSEADIDKAIIDLSLYAMNGKLKCSALGNHCVYVESRTQEHIKNTRGFDRSIEEVNHKAKYIPFIESLLKYGKICEKSSSKQGVIYGIIGQVEYFDSVKNKTVKECVELAINFDKEKRKYVFSFSDFAIKKSLPYNKDSDNFLACLIPDTETVCITVYSLLDSTKKSTVGG